MATYTIIPRIDKMGFDIAIVSNSCVRQTLLGFNTEADAEAWIAQDRLSSALADMIDGDGY
jgi:hypothetical protein